jgi:hypothetical protein
MITQQITLGKSLLRMVLLGRGESTRGPLANLDFPATQVGLKMIDWPDWSRKLSKLSVLLWFVLCTSCLFLTTSPTVYFHKSFCH